MADTSTVLSQVLLNRHDNVSWELLLSPVPMGIAIMSQLMICASLISDMRIDKKPGALMRHPESFRTTLVQIGNDAYTTFMKAHSNMERIQIQMAQVPGYVQESAQILQKGQKNAIEKMLPRRVKRIRKAADDGEKLSKEVANGFDQLIELISQVLEAVSASVGSKEQGIEDQIKVAIEEQKKREMSNAELNHKMAVQEREDFSTKLTATFGSIVLPMLVSPAIGIPLGIASALWMSTNKRVEEAKQEAAKLEDEMKKINEEYIKKLSDMHIDVKQEISRDKAIEVLNQGLKYLSKLKEEWSGIKLFFESVKNIIDDNVTKKLKDFSDDVEDVSSDSSLIDTISNSILEAKLNSQSIYQIAEMYVSVSNRYIVGNVAIIQQMMSLKENELDEAQKKIQKSCVEASEGILAKVKEDRRQQLQSIIDFNDKIKNQQLIEIKSSN